MNIVILKGRLAKDPDIRQGKVKTARYTMAVDRKEGADFISCVCFDKSADFVEKYLSKGTAVLINGRIQTGSYEKDGRKVYTTDVIVNSHEFCERKQKEEPKDDDGFMQIPEVSDEELPFN